MVKLPALCKEIATAILLPLLITTAWAQNVPPRKYSADVPSDITTPNSVETRIGTLKFNNGVPDQKTIQLVYDQIDFVRGICLSDRYGSNIGLRALRGLRPSWL